MAQELAAQPRHAGDGLVGRRREMAAVSAALEEALEGQGRAITIRGEPGIGKTRLVEEIALLARERGAWTLLGRCHEAVDAPPLWPWSQVLEESLRCIDRDPLDRELRAHLAPVAEVLPELAPRVRSGEPRVLEPERARFRAFDGIARFLEAAALRRPLVVILEDVHAADSWSVRLLEFITRDRWSARLLFVATYRDGEVGSSLATLVSTLAGKPHHRELRLAGLAPDESAVLVEQAAGASVPAAVARTVIGRSEGNPLFILELLHDWTGANETMCAGRAPLPEGVDVEKVPASIRALIGRRLEHLGTTCLATLTTAAAIGREFDVAELARVSEIDHGALLALLDEARRASLLTDVAGRIGRFRFTHALVRECLYDTLASAERAALHHRIGAAFEEIHGDEIERHLPEIADHFFRGALVADADKAFALAVRCGRSAAARHAYEEGARQFERALSLWSLLTRRDPRLRGELLIELGTARQWSGEAEQGRATLLSAVDLARKNLDRGEQGGGELLARAILALMQTTRVLGVHDPELVALLEEGLAAVGGDSALRARLLGNLAIAHYWSNAVEERDSLSAAAVEMARRVGDVDTLAFTLFARHFAIFSPARIPEQLTIAEEAVRLGERSRSGEVGLTGRFWQFVDLLILGEVDEARRHWSEYARTADELRQPFFQSNAAIAAATFAMLEGRLDEAENHAVRALDLGRRAGSPNAEQYFGIQMLSLARLRGTEEIVLEPAKAFVERVPGIPAWRAALASIYAALGREREAERELERLAARDFADLPRDANLLVACALSAETCLFLERRPPARVLYDILRPYASRSVVIAIGAGHLGVVSHYLGLLASLLGRADQADAWFADALGRYESMGARPFIARLLVDRAAAASSARARVHVHGRGDPVRAMLERGLGMAREIGLSRLVARAEEMLQERASATPVAPFSSGAAGGGPLFRNEGEYWTIVFADVTARVRDVKGLRYLQELLRVPQRDLHVLDLAAVNSLPPATSRSREGLRAGAGDAGALVDARARDDYRRRIAELHGEIEEAEGHGDLGRAEAARSELDQLTQHLAAAFGVGGRERKVADLTERTRLNVTRAIRAAIGRIAIAHPELARHLESTVVTGRLCRYQPPSGDVPVWSF
jgi:tetratricopeptide (TPR) repeat protein